MNAQGIAKVGAEVVDISVLINTGLKGIHAFLGETLRGPVDKTILVGSWSEFVKHFGGLSDTNDFPLLCKRALEAGTKLRIGRVAHYGDVTDKTTLTGTKASVLADDPVGKISAKSLGTWGNAIRLEVADAANGVTGKVDVTIYVLSGTSKTETETITGVDATLTAEAVAKLNGESNLVEFDADCIGVTINNGDTLTLAGGTDTGTVVATDYTGDSSQATGVHIFDNATDFVRIAAPAKADPVIDIKLTSYAETRQDCRATLRTPVGISGLTAIEYREGEGSYSHSAINSWFASMVYGGLEIVHPTTGAKTTTPALADVAGNYSKKDNNQYEWFTAAGPKRGKISNVLGVDYNLGSAARVTEADQVDIHGLNAVIDDPDYGVVYWGNNTLQKEDTLLKHENVADLVIFLLRAIRPLAKSELFEPNDVSTWKAIHRKVRPLLEEVKKKRGIWDYLYQGDQDVDKVEDVVINNTADIDKGKYVFIVWIKPKVGMKYVGIQISVTNSGVSFEEVTGQP